MVEQWGVEAVFGGTIPASDLLRMTAALNTYNAFISYVSASSNLVHWAETNQKKYDIVSRVMVMRKKQNA